MADLGTVSIVVDVRGQPLVRQLGTDLEKVAVAEKKVSDGAREVIKNFQSIRDIQKQVTRSTNEASNAFQRFSSKELQQASDRLDNYEAALANTRQGMNRFGVVTQQAGYQIGDFLVQVQSGTNWMVAFGQQATQLVGILPMMGSGFLGLSTGGLVALSAGLGIAIPLITALGAAWMRTTEEVETGANRQKEAYDSVVESIRTLRLERQMDVSGAQTEAEQTTLNEINRLLEERSVLQGRLNQLQNAGGRAAGFAAEKAAQIELLQIELDKNQALIDALNNERQIEIASRRRANEQRRAYEEAREAADDLYDGLIKAAEVNLAKAFDEAMPFAQNLVDKVSEIYSNMLSIVNFRQAQQRIAASGLTYSGRGSDPRTANQLGYGEFVYTGPPLDANNNVIAAGAGSASRLRKQIDLTKELTQVEKDRREILKSIEGSLESGFMTMIEGTKSVKDAFKQMAYEIIRELYRVLVVQRLVGGISGGIGMLVGKSTGSFGTPFGLATGGSVMPNQPYLVGENGPELVIPRHSGTVVNANQTANALGGSGGVTVQNNITVTGSDAAMVRAEVAKMIPQITNATKAAVIDARLRGGQMKAAFS